MVDTAIQTSIRSHDVDCIQDDLSMPNRCYAISIEGQLLGNYRENVLHFQSTGTNDNDTLAASESLNGGWFTNIMGLWLATLPASYQLYRLSSRRVDLKPSATGHRYLGIGTHPGTRGTDATSQQCCPSIFLIPTMGTFSGGKIFWPAIPQGDLVNNVVSTGWQTAVDACIAAMVSGFTSSSITWSLAIYSKKRNTISAVTSHSYSPYVGFLVKRRGPSETMARRRHKKRIP